MIANLKGKRTRDGRGTGNRPGQARGTSFTWLFVRFAGTGLVAVVVIGAVAFEILRHSATNSALREAKGLAALAGRGIAAPLLTRGVLNGDPRSLQHLDRVVRRRILRGTPIVRVKVWDASGRIVYSDAPQLIGVRYALGSDETTALRHGGIDADASDLGRPENRTERRFRRLVEVYVGVRAPDGTRLLYENYERSSTISANSRQQWEGLLPAIGGALLVLYLIQVPLAYSLARGLRQRQLEREQLLRRAIDASDLERRRIAADLHDSTVQRLAAVSLSLAASAAQNGSGAASGEYEQLRKAAANAAAETRETIRELRTLLVDIYPPTLQRSGLLAAIVDLVAPLRSAGIAVSIDVPEEPHLAEQTEALLYRVAQEAIRNARTHGDPSAVTVQLEVRPDRASLRVTDDGRGFSVAKAGQQQQDSHFGLRLMRDLVDHAGGELSVVSAPGRGTSVVLTVPLK